MVRAEHAVPRGVFRGWCTSHEAHWFVPLHVELDKILGDGCLHQRSVRRYVLTFIIQFEHRAS